MRRRSRILALASTLALLSSGVAAAAVSPGTYKATGGVTFKFVVVRGTCASPPANVNGTKLGKAKKGLCYLGGTEPVVDTPCANGKKLMGDQASTDPGFVTGLRLSPSGKLHFRRFTYGAGAKTPDGYSDLQLTITGKTAKGVVRRTNTYSDANGAVKCDTGDLRFTAKR